MSLLLLVFATIACSIMAEIALTPLGWLHSSLPAWTVWLLAAGVLSWLFGD